MSQNLKSDKNLTDKASSILKSKCTNLGTKNVNASGDTNLSGMSDLESIYSNVNTVLKKYKEVLHSDANHTKSLGIYFSDVDKLMKNKM